MGSRLKDDRQDAILRVIEDAMTTLEMALATLAQAERDILDDCQDRAAADAPRARITQLHEVSGAG
jgi:hypothetical protein